jgi:hypothetical protein
MPVDPMNWLRYPAFSIVFLATALAAEQPSALDLAAALQHITLDPQDTYHVRDVRLRRGDISIYFNEGVLSFATPVAGKRVAAVFTTKGVDAGDAEILVMPPQAAERASLASFTKFPNLDEHFSSAIFFFSDDTRDEVLNQLSQRTAGKAPEVAAELAPKIDPILQKSSSQISTRTIESLLDAHAPQNGFFFSMILGHELGTFDLLYEPEDLEPVTLGQVKSDKDMASHFELWTAYRPRHAPAYVTSPPLIADYRIDATIEPDLSLNATAAFAITARPDCGRIIPLNLTKRLKVESAKLDGQPVEFYQNYSADFSSADTDSEFLLVAGQPLTPGRTYKVEIQYGGSVIRRISDSSYFVSERNIWYPHTTPMLTTFDLTFHFPERYGLVSTGELTTDTVANGIRTVHRATQVPEQLAGFNLGEYKSLAIERGPYRVECYADQSGAKDMNGIPQACESILDDYTLEWGKLPIHTLAVTPIAGYFGQGFPGLIYLSSTAYLPERDRPNEVRNQRADTFFSDVLLPHEIAHQWWGNMVSSASYRTEWLMESMANYSALQLLEKKKGEGALSAMTGQFRDDLLHIIDGKTIDSLGPVDFGLRLLDAHGEAAWHTIVYEKGTWILHMLRERMGDEGFHRMQLEMLRQYSGKPITNEEFRKVASAFIPAGQPDRDLNTFFDTWVYGTGIPTIRLTRSGSSPASNIQVSGVDDAFTADLPLRCKTKKGEGLKWVRIVSGSNPIPDSGQVHACRLPPPSEYLYVE